MIFYLKIEYMKTVLNNVKIKNLAQDLVTVVDVYSIKHVKQDGRMP
jgi:hypothetical protein